MSNKKVIIIGAGIAGLSLGSYLQMNGYEVQILEKESQVGGLCTSWKRKGYLIDGCITWLVGSGENHIFHKFWKELGIIPKLQFKQSEFKRLAPEDNLLIENLYQAIKGISNSELDLEKSPELFTYEDFINFKKKSGTYMKVMKDWKVKIKDFVQNFKSPLIRENFEQIFWFNSNTYMSYFIATLAWCDMKSCGYSLDSSLEFSKAIQEKFENLGGTIHFNYSTKEIIVENNKAIGIKNTNGESLRGDLIISACDGYTTIYKMLKGKYKNSDIDFIYENLNTTKPKLRVSLCLRKNKKSLPHYFNFYSKKPIKTSDSTSDSNIYVNNYSDRNFLKPNTSILALSVNTDYNYWENLKKHRRNLYKYEKKRIAKELIQEFESMFGDINEHIDFIDIATPVTFNRYTNNYNGSILGWEKEAFSFENEDKVKRELPNLSNFYMVGHWSLVGGGLPSVMLQSRNLAQLICAKDDKTFSTHN